MTKIYLVLHHHNHGVDSGLVQSSHLPSEKEVIEALDLDFDAEGMEEYIDILPQDKIVEIK